MTVDYKDAAGHAQEAIQEFQKIEPWLATIIPIVIPAAAPAMPLINAFAPVLLTFVARALGDIASENGGDLPAALIELFQHLSRGQPNSPTLSHNARPDPVPNLGPANTGA